MATRGVENRRMTTARQDPIRFLYLEHQFCSLCRAEGRHHVRVFDLSVDGPTRPGWKARRRAAALAHLLSEHPRQHAEVTR